MNNLFKKLLAPRVAPGLVVDPVLHSDVINTYYLVLHSLTIAYLESRGGTPSDAICAVMHKTGEWLVQVVKNKRSQKFLDSSLNKTSCITYEMMGREVAKDFGIQKEYAEIYSLDRTCKNPGRRGREVDPE